MTDLRNVLFVPYSSPAFPAAAAPCLRGIDHAVIAMEGHTFLNPSIP